MSKFNPGKASVLALTAVLAVAAFLLGKSLTSVSAGTSHTDNRWVDTSDCVATQCGSSVGTKTQICEHHNGSDDECSTSHTEYADGICPIGYHWQNNGNWNERCHRNNNDINPEHTAPTGCPADYTHVGNSCQKTVPADTQTVACNDAPIVDCEPNATPSPTPEATPGPSNEGGNSSSQAGPSVCNATKPGTPTILSAVRTGNSEILTWSAVANATYYSIVYGSAPGYQYGVANTGNVTSYTINGLTPGVGYHFAVNAVNDCMPGDPGTPAGTGTGGQVLGASTMAGTGSFAEVFYQAIMGIGATLSAFGLKGLKKASKK